MRPSSGRRDAGFSLAELVVAAAVMAVILVGVLNLFDFTSRVSRVQLQLAELQQNQRVAHQELVRMVRMAGRGGLASVPPLDQSDATTFPPPRLAVHRAPSFRLGNNVDVGTTIADATSPLVEPGTDVLTLRGVLSTPVYVVNYFNPTSYTWNPATNAGTLIVPEETPDGRKQDLTPLRTARAAGNEALVLVSALNDEIYGVARLTNAGIDTAGSATLNFVMDNNYNPLSSAGVFPGYQRNPPPAAPVAPAMQKVGYVGILEEYRYYVRQDTRDGASWPKFSRARVFPNTPTAHSAGSLQDDLVEGVFDFQVALGYDSAVAGSFATDADTVGNDDLLLETADGTNDDWLFNAAVDDPDDEPWSPPVDTGIWSAAAPRPRHFYLRFTTAVRTERMDRGYQAPFLTRIEDHVPTDPGRQYRRQLLQTLVDLRNVG